MSVFPLFVILLIVAMFVIGGIVALCLYFNEKKKQQTYGMNGRAYQMDNNNQDMNQQEQQVQDNEQANQQVQQPYQPIQQPQYPQNQYQQNQYQQNPYQQNQYQQYQYQQNQYQQNQQSYQNMGPLLQTDRSLAKVIILSILTCGIYYIIFCVGIADDINRVASARDGKTTTHYLLALVLLPLTCGIYYIYWWHTISDRIGEEARARGSYTDFSATTFWLWELVGLFLCLLGPFVYIHKLCQVMNQINNSYNQYGR